MLYNEKPKKKQYRGAAPFKLRPHWQWSLKLKVKDKDCNPGNHLSLYQGYWKTSRKDG